jgi:hypothetical protein
MNRETLNLAILLHRNRGAEINILDYLHDAITVSIPRTIAPEDSAAALSAFTGFTVSVTHSEPYGVGTLVILGVPADVQSTTR